MNAGVAPSHKVLIALEGNLSGDIFRIELQGVSEVSGGGLQLIVFLELNRPIVERARIKAGEHCGFAIGFGSQMRLEVKPIQKSIPGRAARFIQVSQERLDRLRLSAAPKALVFIN